MDGHDSAWLDEFMPGEPVLKQSLLGVVAVNEDEVRRFVPSRRLGASRLECARHAIVITCSTPS